MSQLVVTGSDRNRNKLIFKMFSVVVLCVAALCMPAQAQPVSCKEDAQCHDGYYCETDAHICRECLSCEDLKREPPLAINTCIKSVAECGACIDELVVDVRSGDVNAECVKPDPSPREGPQSYVWLIVIAVLVFSLIVIGIIVYLLRNPEIFKNVGSNPSSTVTACITTATAPEPPPPYNPLPPPTPYQHSSAYSDVEPTTYDEAEQFIKPPLFRPQGTRESAGNQAAIVYNRPRYDESEPPSAESPVPEYTENMTVPIDHDEDTIPSSWMPGTISNGDVNANVVNDNNTNESEGAAVALPALLATAQDTTLVEPSTAKRKCMRQESRESNCGESSNSNFQRPPSPSQGGNRYPKYFITNVVIANK